MSMTRVAFTICILILLFLDVGSTATLVPTNFIDQDGVQLQKLSRSVARYYSQQIWGSQIDLFRQPYDVGRLQPWLNAYVLFYTDSNWHRIIYKEYMWSVAEEEWEATYIGSLGSHGSEQGQFRSPRGLSVHGGTYGDGYYIYVADCGNNRIVVLKYVAWAPEGERLSFHSTYGENDGMNHPMDVCGGSSEAETWVVDTGNHRIMQYYDGSLVDSYGGYGHGEGSFCNPTSITHISSPHVARYVCDAGNQRIVKLTHPFSWNRTLDLPGTYLSGIAADSRTVLVSDRLNARIASIDLYLMNFNFVYGSEGTGPGQFLAPFSLTLIGDELSVMEYYGDNSGVQYYTLDLSPSPSDDPSDLTATALSEDGIRLEWTDNCEIEEGFEIWRKKEGDFNYTKVGTAGQNETTYDDSGLDRGTQYHYRVRGYAPLYYTGFSNPASATTFWLSTPTDLTATTTHPYQVDLNWTDNSNFTEGFEVWRGTSPEDLRTYDGEVPSPYFKDNGVSSSKWYFYKVRAYDSGRWHYSEFSNEANTFTSIVESTSPEVLEFNNARKIIYSAGKLHLVYTYSDTDPWLRSINYRESVDGGRTWTEPNDFDFGTHPAITVGPSGVIALVWDCGSKLKYRYKSGEEWSPPTYLTPGVEYDATPSIVVDQNEIVHIAVTKYILDPGPPPREKWQISVCTFPVTSPEERVWSRVTEEYVDPSWKVPSIAITQNGTPHVIWQRGDQIYHSYNSGAWTTPERIGSGQGQYPRITSGPGETVYAVWDENMVNLQFGEFSGGAWVVETIASDIFGYPSFFPVILYAQGTIYVVWNEMGLGSDNQIWYAKKTPPLSWSTPKEWVKTARNSLLPHIAFDVYSPVVWSHLYLVWDENDYSAPYYVGSTVKRMYAQDRPRDPTLSLSLGGESLTPYTVQRDGYFDYGYISYQTVDYDTTELLYEIPGLDPNGNYILEMEYYHEFPGAVQQALSVDGIPLQDTIAPPGELVSAEGMISQIMLEDSTILVSVAKTEGDFAVAGFLTLWGEEEDPPRGRGGGEGRGSITQLAGNRYRRLPRVYGLSQNAPNPFTSRTTILYQLPRTSRVALSIYNVAGQLVRTLGDGNQRPGYYEVEWNGNDDNGTEMPSGVYFYRLQANDFTARKKLILLR